MHGTSVAVPVAQAGMVARAATEPVALSFYVVVWRNAAVCNWWSSVIIFQVDNYSMNGGNLNKYSSLNDI